MTRLTTLRRRLAAVVLGLLPLIALADAPPAVAAAASLKPALETIASQFRAAGGGPLRLSFGSSGNLYRQILQGAPFELFLAADEAFVLQLVQAGRAVDEGVVYATGRLVLFAPHDAPLAVDEQGRGLAAALAGGHIHRFAIANPEHAPYGRAAREALQTLGLWEKLQPSLVLGENVAQAAQFAASGSTQGGVFAYSLALLPALRERGRFALLPERLHRPLRQRMVLLKTAGTAARDFYRYLQRPPARLVWRRYGFRLPGE